MSVDDLCAVFGFDCRVCENASQLGDLIQDFDFAQSPRPPMLLSTDPKTGTGAGSVAELTWRAFETFQVSVPNSIELLYWRYDDQKIGISSLYHRRVHPLWRGKRRFRPIETKS